MMRCLLVLFPLFVGVWSDCNAVRGEHQRCIKQAHTTYTSAFRSGSDGRGSFNARKTCNYMTAALEVCPEKLKKDGCASDQEVIAMKDMQMKLILKTVKSSVAEWDSCKCPPIKAHLDRMKAKEGAEVEEECPPLSANLFQMGNLVESEQSSPDNEDFDLSFGGLIVATGVFLAKPILLAFY